jgi:diacylglycerol kinase
LLPEAASALFTFARGAKDWAAGAILITALAARVIGAIIFWPHLTRIFSQ